MKRFKKLFKGTSPNKHKQQQHRQEHHLGYGGGGGGGGRAQGVGRDNSGSNSLRDGTIYTTNEVPASRRQHGNGNGHPPQQHHQQQQQQHTFVNEQGHRVTTTTVRVPASVSAPAPAHNSPQRQQHQQYQNGSPTQTQPARDPPPPPSPGAPPAAAAPPAGPTTTTATTATPEPDPIHAANEMTRNLVKKFIADIWNRGEIDLIPEVCSPNLRFNGNAGFDRIGHDGLARMVATIRSSLDEYHCEIHSMVVESNKAFCRLRFTGKHTGPLLGYEPTNKVVAWMGATEFTCQNGKILKVWELGDVKSLEEQLQPDNVGSKGADNNNIEVDEI